METGGQRRPTAASRVWGAPTSWTLVARASNLDADPDVHAAWTTLVERYRHPVQSWVRRRLGPTPLAQEIADDFFAYLFERRLLVRADRDVGRFRCFLQGILRNYLKAALRGRARRDVELDALADPVAALGEERAQQLDEQEETDWALAVLAHACERLVEVLPRDGELLLRSYGIAPYEAADRDELCARSGLERNALHQATFRARRKLRELVVEEIGRQVVSDADREAETKLLIDRIVAARPGLVDTGD